MTGALVVVVRGTVAGQGSKTRTRHGMRDDNAHTLRPWRDAVRHEADTAIGDGLRPHNSRTVPVAVEVTFTLARPRHHYRTGRHAGQLRPAAPTRPAALPDIDKAVRAVLDALTDAGAWDDDRQVVELVARKTYPGGGDDALDVPGAVIRIQGLPE